MLAISLPFVVVLLLLILLIRMSGAWGGTPADGNTRLFVAACAVLVTIVGLRWGLDLKLMRLVQPIAAATLPPIAWFCFTRLARPDRPIARSAGRRRWLHTLPVVLVVVLSASWNPWRAPIDLVLATLYFAYGVALLRLAAGGPDGLDAVRISEAPATHQIVTITGFALIGSGLVDMLVAADLGLSQGSHSPSIIAVANLATLVLIAGLVAIVGRSRPASEPADSDSAVDLVTEPASQPQPEDPDIVATIDRLMRERQLFRDPDLTLGRLARRAGIPARQISGAINRVHRRNVSQVVNEYRIAEAKRLLDQTDQPITEIMFACGFQTKSNFNREFRRVAGATPSDYRQASQGRAGAGPVNPPVNPLGAHPPGT